MYAGELVASLAFRAIRHGSKEGGMVEKFSVARFYLSIGFIYVSN